MKPSSYRNNIKRKIANKAPPNTSEDFVTIRLKRKQAESLLEVIEKIQKQIL